MKVEVDVFPEFGVEIVLALPYAYWLHQNNKLEKVVTSKGMRPLYYFTDNVEEKYSYRTIDSKMANLPSLPNSWIHGLKETAELYKDIWPDWEIFSNVEKGCGILDYRKWIMPSYDHIKNEIFKTDRPYVIISNRYNFEHGHHPVGFFDLECLYTLFNYLIEKGYNIVYKRPKNTEFPIDQNEANTVQRKYSLSANVNGSEMTDFELTKYFENVILLDDIVAENPTLSYNEVQMQLFSGCKGVIAQGGGSSIFPCIFKKPIVSYFGKDMQESGRVGYFEKDGVKNIMTYYYKINENIIPFLDHKGLELKNKYINFIETVKSVF